MFQQADAEGGSTGVRIGWRFFLFALFQFWMQVVAVGVLNRLFPTIHAAVIFSKVRWTIQDALNCLIFNRINGRVIERQPMCLWYEFSQSVCAQMITCLQGGSGNSTFIGLHYSAMGSTFLICFSISFVNLFSFSGQSVACL